MHPEDIEKTKKLIQQSTLLSPVEKAEWLQMLSDMNDKQISELIAILQPKAASTAPAPAPAPAPKMPEPKAPPAPAPKPLKVDLAQKEIGTSIPFFEPEIPAHTGSAAPVPAAPQAVSKTEAKIPAPDPADLQSRVESIVRELQQKKTGAPVPAAPAHPAAAAAPKPAAPFHPTGKIAALKDATDFSHLDPADIRGQDPNAALQAILSKIAELSRKSKIFEIIANLEKSSLYQAYIEIGFALLNDPNPDREAAYEIMLEKLKRDAKPWLSKEEFEAFMDFRKRLDQMI